MSMRAQFTAPPPTAPPSSENVAAAERRSMAAAHVQCARSTPLLLPAALAAASTTMNALDAMRQEPTGESSPRGGAAAARATQEEEATPPFNTDHALSAEFYSQQVQACGEIIKNFLDGTITYVMLLAQMQSGKSDCFMLAGAELVRLGMIDEFVVICGNSETALCDQAKSQGKFWDKYQDYLIELGGGWNKDNARRGRDLRRVMENDLSDVVFGAQLNTYTSDTTKRTLFIWDESHYAQSQGNRPDKFFQKNGLNATGEPIPGGNLMLSVSATPFSEIIVNCNKQNKPVVVMTPGDTYIGLAAMIENDQIVEYNLRNIDDVIRVRVQEVMAAQERNDARCWGLIRCDAKSEEIVKKYYRGDVIKHDASDKTDINKYLEGKTTHKNGGIIILCKSGKVKMGKQLTSKHHILWVMETAAAPNTDTLLQGLLGRCMGYPESSDANAEIKIYIPAKVLECGNDGLNELERYVNYFNETAAAPECIPETAPPTRAMNVVSKCQSHIMRDSETDRPIFPVVTDLIDIDLGEFNEGGISCDYTKGDVYNALADKVNEGDYHTTNNDVRLRKLLARGLEHCDITISALDDNHNKKYEDHLTDLNNSHEEQKVHRVAGASLGCRENQIKLWCLNCKRAGRKLKFDNPRESIIKCFIEYRSDVAHPSDSDARLEVDTSLREVFSHAGPPDEDGHQEPIVSNGVYAARLSVETATDVGEMLEVIRHCIDTSLTNAPDAVTLPREITSEATNNCNHPWKGISVNREVEEALKKGGEIYETLLKEFNVKIKTAGERGRPPAAFTASSFTARYSKIKW